MLSLSIIEITVNSISLAATPNSNGAMYYQIRAIPSQSKVLSLFEIKSKLKDGTTALQKQTDNVSTIYTYRRDAFIGMIGVYTSSKNYLTIDSLTSGITYTICAYLETQFLLSTSTPNCFSFTTMGN